MNCTARILNDACSEGLYTFRAGVYFRSGSGERFPDPPEQLLDTDQILKNSRSVVSGFDRDRSCFVKVYRKNGFFRTMKRLLQYPRSRRCLAAALKLQRIGVETPAVLLASRYCLITEVLTSVQYLTECPERARELVPLLAKLHDNGIRHGDFNLRNIYRKAEGTFGLIDLDGSRLYDGAVPRKVRFLELARLISSYLKSVEHDKTQFPLIAADFASEYSRLTKFDLYGPRLLERVVDLVGRR